MPGACRKAPSRYSRAREIAVRSSQPTARLAAIADDSVQPVPCVCAVSMRGIRTSKVSCAVHATSTDSGPARCPPLTSTTRGPSFRIRWPAARMSSTERIVISANTSASGRLGVTMCERGRSSLRMAATASASSRRSPPLATMTGSTTTSGRSSSAIAAATASTMAAVASMPTLTASAPMSPATASICAVTRSVSIARHIVTPSVFWAVTAVMAQVPYT